MNSIVRPIFIPMRGTIKLPLVGAAAPIKGGGGSPSLPNPQYGLITATADGSTGQTYTLNAAWTGVQWYRMALASPYGLTAISGATGSTYVAQVADEGYRLAAVGLDGANQKAAKSYHVVLAPPVLLESFDSLAGWAASAGGVLELVTDGVDQGVKRLQLTSTGTANAQGTKADIGSFDPSTMGTIVFSADLGMDTARQGVQNHRVVLRRDGTDHYLINVTTTGTNYETPSPLHLGKLWGGYHVSEVSALATPGISTMGLYVRQAGAPPYSQVTKYDALLGRAGGRPIAIIGFDDNKLTQFTTAYPIMKERDLPFGWYLAGQLTQNSAFMSVAMLQEMYADGNDCYLDSTWNDDITSSLGTLAAAAASLQQNRDFAVANGMPRGNEHVCYTHGQIETNPPSNRVQVSAVTSDGSNVVTIGGTVTRYPTSTPIAVGMRMVGHNSTDPTITVAEIIGGGTQVRVSQNIPAQTKPMLFVDESPEFYTMKLPKQMASMGVRTARTTRNQGPYISRFGFGDRGMFTFGHGLHGYTLANFQAAIDLTILRGGTIEWYTHGVFDGGSGTESDTADFMAKMNYLAAKRDAGLIDVMTWSQVWARDGGATVPA